MREHAALLGWQRPSVPPGKERRRDVASCSIRVQSLCCCTVPHRNQTDFLVRLDELWDLMISSLRQVSKRAAERTQLISSLRQVSKRAAERTQLPVPRKASPEEDPVSFSRCATTIISGLRKRSGHRSAAAWFHACLPFRIYVVLSKTASSMTPMPLRR